jgi:hypothetical protein
MARQTMNSDLLERSEERNRIRATLGLPPLSPDGMTVLGNYADYWTEDQLLAGQCEWCGGLSENIRSCEHCGEDRCARCLSRQGQCCRCARERKSRAPWRRL